MSMSAAFFSFYCTHGPMSDPGEFFPAALPNSLPELVQIVQQNLLHIFWAERYGRTLTNEEKSTVNLRRIKEKLALLASSHRASASELQPAAGDFLLTAKTPSQRQAGNCRDFSLMLVSLLRSQGIPARARCGFGRYFTPGRYEDHWVAEYWNQAQDRWILVDAQLDDLQCKVLQPPFDPLDVPRDQFILAGDAWQMCRQGRADPKDFGIFEMNGWWFIWGNVAREFLSLNKIEILPWDYQIGVFSHRLEEPLASNLDELAFYDRIAALTLAGDQAFSEIRQLHDADPRWRVPAEWLEVS